MVAYGDDPTFLRYLIGETITYITFMIENLVKKKKKNRTLMKR